MKFITDPWIVLTYLLASTLSLFMLASVSPDRLVQQAVMLAVGLGIILYLSRQDSSIFFAFAPLGYVLSILLLLFTFIFGATIRGSARWIMLGTFQLQTGELAKPLLILAFAYFLEKYPPRSVRHLLLNFALFLLPTWLIFQQPDLGTALVITTIWGLQLFLAGVSWWVVGITGAFSALTLRFLPQLLRPYQLDRLRSFLDPYHDPLGAGYNVIQSIIAIGSGGLWGKGLGHGTQSHLRFLPERHTDFAFASLAEELGLLGSLVVILILGALLFRLLTVLTHAPSSRTRIILAGVFASLFFQSVINIGMNLGVAPVTGVTLPLISYGGSSILAVSLTLGIALSVIRTSNSGRSLLEIK